MQLLRTAGRRLYATFTSTSTVVRQARGVEPSGGVSLRVEKQDSHDAFAVVGPGAEGNRVDARPVLDLDPPAPPPTTRPMWTRIEPVLGPDDDLPADRPRRLQRVHLGRREFLRRHGHGPHGQPEGEEQQRVDRPALAAAHRFSLRDSVSVSVQLPQAAGQPEDGLHPLELARASPP
jgi:hypothetical protein